MIKTAKIARGLTALVAAGALAFAMMLATPGKALAVDPPTADDKVVTITKKLEGTALQLPASQNFTFQFTKVSVNDLTDTADLNTMPAIPDLTIPIGTDAGKYISKDEDGGITTLRNDGTVDIKDLTFTHAGVYAYKVAETGTASGVTMSQAEYTLRIYVKNTTSGVVVDQVTVEKNKEDDGGASTGKVDPNPTPTNSGNPDTTTNPGTDVDGGSGFLFVNTIDFVNSDLTISKTVAGDHADKSKKFTFSLKIDAPFGSDSGQPDKAWVATINGQEHRFMTGVAKTFELGDGESLVFAQLPIGTTYNYTETGVSGYTASSSTITGGGAAVPQTGQLGTNFTLEHDALVGQGVNSSAVTNTYKNVTPTGIAIEVLPFVLMIAVPVLAAAGYLFAKRRRSANVTNA